MDYEAISGKLEGEYRMVFEEVEAYATLKNYVGEGKEELMMNLLDMLLTAQTEGKVPARIVGSDVKRFCDDYFSAYDKKAGRIERLVSGLTLYAWLGLFNCILDLFDDDMHFVHLTAGSKTDWTGMLCGIGVALLTITVLDGVLGIIYRKRLPQFGKLVNIILIVAVISAGLGSVIAGICDVVVLLPLIPTLIICILVIIICFTYKRVKNYQRYGSVWKPKEERETSKPMYFNSDVDEVSSEYERQMIENFAQVYRKKNEKQMKKNKPALTPEEFMEFLEKENEKLKKDSRRMPLLWVCICVFTTVVMAMTGGFAGFVDGCIFFAILAGIMFVIYYFIFGRFFYGKILSDRVRLFEKCRRNNKTILDYAEKEK